ncbi:AfsR/SARP family transcriptional regulator [Microbacterium halotolerans]|uniref:AfsR/SARP family transcriptional regulator n=1 Tax=Microbacterium halotolerans TaxID=246613 RepID=UPI000E6AC6E1|nr:AfsR/SARP family transcriptional regulator [Microbacterium halotolerans]
MNAVGVRVLGSLQVTSGADEIVISKPRLRELLALLIIGRSQPVPSWQLIDDLWDGSPPNNPLGALRTFVGELRRLLEPDRRPHEKTALLVTEAAGYSLRLPDDSVDVWRVTRLVSQAHGASPDAVASKLGAAAAEWRGDAFEEFADRAWALRQRSRFTALRADVRERLAEAQISCGRAQEAVALLDSHVIEHPWREDGWRLLADALHHANRQAEALEVLRRARTVLVDDLGLDPGPALAAAERDILRQRGPRRWSDDALTALEKSRSRTRLEASGAILSSLAVAGDLETVRSQRLAAILAAERIGDPKLTARVIGGLEAPGVWTRSDDAALADEVVAAAERTLPHLGHGSHARARLLSVIALEDRGAAARVREAGEAVQIARSSGDALLLCLALSGRFMQTFARAGLAAERAEIGAEIIDAALRSESVTFEISGRIIRMQALCALDRVEEAAVEADAIDDLARDVERPLARVFTDWFRHAFRGAPEPESTDQMPGFSRGIGALSRLIRTRRVDGIDEGSLGPHAPWAMPLVHLLQGRPDDARTALRDAPAPPADLLLETYWVLLASAAHELDDEHTLARARRALEPALGERAAGSGVIDAGDIRQSFAACSTA